MQRGQVRMDISATGFEGRVLHDAACADDGPAGCAGGAAAAYVHDVRIPWLRVEPAMSVGLGRRVFLSMSLPLDLRYRAVSYTTRDGDRYAPADPAFHHAPGLQAGPTDGRAAVWIADRVDAVSWAFGLGTTLPWGTVVDDPYLLEAEGVAHEHLLMGSGTFVPAGTVRVGVDGRRWGGHLQLDVREPVYTNARGYRPGEVISWSSGPSWKAAPLVSLLASVETTHQDAERWHDVEYGGMHMIGVSAAVLWQVDLQLNLQARIRYNFTHVAYESFGDEQIRKPLMLTIAGSWTSREPSRRSLAPKR